MSISASNLDEFYSVRVAGLIGQAKAGVDRGLARRPHAGAAAGRDQGRAPRRCSPTSSGSGANCAACCARPGIEVCEPSDLTADDVTWLDAWFMERVFPVLTPLAIDPAHPFPFIPNMGLVMALLLVREEDGQGMRALLPLPSQVERFIRLPGVEPAGRSAS